MRQHRSMRGAAAALATVLAAASLAGCMDFLELAPLDPGRTAAAQTPGDTPRPAAAAARRPDTATVTVRVAGMAAAAGAVTLASTPGSGDTIEAVNVSVSRRNAGGAPPDPLAEAALSLSRGVWTGTLTDLPLDTELTFTAQALNGDDQERFNGTHTGRLGGADGQITIVLRAVGASRTGRLPVVTAITAPPVDPGQTAAVAVAVRGSGSETFGYEFDGGTFAPAAGRVDLTAGAGRFTSSYQAPGVAGQYQPRVAVRNAQGHRTEVAFRIRVGDPTSGPATTISTPLAPVVRGITGRRAPNGVVWTADASASGKAALTFAWSFSGSETFRDATANPATLTGYGATTAGTLTVTVTANGLSTTATLTVAAGMFPDAPQVAELLINEIDYDTPGRDDREFAEILNPGSAAVTLDAYRVDLVKGEDLTAYASYPLSGELPAGGFLVIADRKVIDVLPGADETPPGTPSIKLNSRGLQQGPDAVRIVEKATGRVVDAVHYKGEVRGVGEGKPAPRDPSTASEADHSNSIGRCPNGADSDDNLADFTTMASTPGAANTCST